ncbi:LysM domain-containing protein [Ureibacillus xyleni]|uniref:LysM domain-containing protein n=1 Tax=Ureibacillus xyleni TaxID=614648 RepID=A0A285RJH3_9BACL|nr:LysM peptidoglycan-binding domain-containing protein [Ureibacillus xyleni]SOB94263.1 LysM domain-containing protein [Ureibacillus xyleni]
MSKEDYREKIEEHRQLIEIEEKNSRMARTRRKVKKKKRKNPLMSILLFIFIVIPVMVLVYVTFLYKPGEQEVAKVDNGGAVVEVQKNDTLSSGGKDEPKPAIEDNEDKESKDQTNKKPVATEDTKQAELESAKKAEQAKQQELEKQKALEKQKELEKQKQQEQQKSSEQKVHTVQSNENLFRIAMKYYNDPSGVEKIKAANGLGSDSISVGQTLIIP